jgi:hypothetical protein
MFPSEIVIELALPLVCSLTQARSYALKVELVDASNVYKAANYSDFRLTNNVTYNLEVGGFYSDPSLYVGDALGAADGAAFSTEDADHDDVVYLNCALSQMSAGW